MVKPCDMITHHMNIMLAKPTCVHGMSWSYHTGIVVTFSPAWDIMLAKPTCVSWCANKSLLQYIHTACGHMCTHAPMHTCTHGCKHPWVHVGMGARAHLCAHAVCMYRHTCTHACAHVSARRHMGTCVCACAHMYTHMDTHMHACVFPCVWAQGSMSMILLCSVG